VCFVCIVTEFTVNKQSTPKPIRITVIQLEITMPKSERGE